MRAKLDRLDRQLLACLQRALAAGQSRTGHDNLLEDAEGSRLTL